MSRATKTKESQGAQIQVARNSSIGRSKTSKLNSHPVEEFRPTNAPDLVRSSFLQYLKTEFPYSMDWSHPVTKTTYSCESIKQKLEALKVCNPQTYKALWALWTTRATRAFLAERLNYSGSTIRRLWDRGIDTVLLMLLYPDLDPGIFQLYDTEY